MLSWKINTAVFSVCAHLFPERIYSAVDFITCYSSNLPGRVCCYPCQVLTIEPGLYLPVSSRVPER